MCMLYRMLQICNEYYLAQNKMQDTYNKGKAQEMLLICSFSA